MSSNGLVEKEFFNGVDFLQDENLWSMVGKRWRLCIISFLKASVLEKLDFVDVVLVVFVLLL
jgi:hypothetical protein